MNVLQLLTQPCAVADSTMLRSQPACTSRGSVMPYAFHGQASRPSPSRCSTASHTPELQVLMGWKLLHHEFCTLPVGVLAVMCTCRCRRQCLSVSLERTTHGHSTKRPLSSVKCGGPHKYACATRLSGVQERTRASDTYRLRARSKCVNTAKFITSILIFTFILTTLSYMFT